MKTTEPAAQVLPYQAIAASYLTHTGAENAVRSLTASGLETATISVIGLDYEVHNRVHGLLHAMDVDLLGILQDAWFYNIYELLKCDVGFFAHPTTGPLLVMGHLSQVMADANDDSDVGSFIAGLTDAGIPRERAVTYQARLQAGEFLVLVHGDPGEVTRALPILEETGPTRLKAHWATMDSQGAALSLGPKCSN